MAQADALEQLSVARRLGGLGEDGPADRRAGGPQVEVPQVAEQQQGGLGPAAEQLRAFSWMAVSGPPELESTGSTSPP
jgi:hypothetical protein